MGRYHKNYFGKKHINFGIKRLILLVVIGVISCLAAWKPKISFDLVCDDNVAVKIFYNNQKEDLFDLLHSRTFVVNAKEMDRIAVVVGNYRQINSLRIAFSETEREITLNNFEISYFPFIVYHVKAQQIINEGAFVNIQNVKLDSEKIYIYGCYEDSFLCLPDIKGIISNAKASVDWFFILRFVRNIIILLICMQIVWRIEDINLEREKIAKRIVTWIIYSAVMAFVIEVICVPVINFFVIYLPLENLRNYFLSTYNLSLSRCYFISIILLAISSIKILGKEHVYKNRYALAVILLVLLVGGKFSYSSINAYDLMLSGNTIGYESPTLLGRAQGIRADEWAIEKPYYFAQAAEGVDFPYYNDNLMISGADMMVMAAAPVKDLMILTHPALLGFLFLPIEYAFSFYWNFRIILLFMSAFELGNILFKRREYALALALSLLFLPPIQWTLSQWLIDIIIWGQVAVVIWFRLIMENRKSVRILLAASLAGAINCYIYVMYPAAQLPFAYFFLGCVCIIAYEHKEKKPFAIAMWAYYLPIMIVVMAFAGYFMSKSATALNVMMNTVYPGQSRVWGTYSWDYELLPFMNLFTAVWKDSLYLNNTETAQFIYFLPHIIIASLCLLKRNTHDSDVKALLFLEAIVLLFEIIAKMPERTFLGKLLFWDVSYPRRMQLVVGYGFFIIMWLIIDILSRKNINITKVRNYNTIIFIAVSFSALYSPTLREYFKIGQSYIGTVTICLLVGLYTYVGAWIYNQRTHKRFVTVYLAICILSTCWVNPVINNMDCIFEKSSVKAVQKVAKDDAEGRWITSGNAGIGNMISSLGIKRCSGYYYYPDFDMMKIIDPDLKYIQLWNSFSAIDMRLTDGENFVDSPNNDVALVVWINKETAEKLGIKYIFSLNYDYTNLVDRGELELLYKDNVDKVCIYQVVYNK